MFTGSLPAIPNTSDWTESASVNDADTDELIDLSDMTEFEAIIRDIDNRRCDRVKSTFTGGGVTVTEPGIIQWTFSETALRCLCAGTYQFVARITKDGTVTDLLIASLTVVDG